MAMTMVPTWTLADRLRKARELTGHTQKEWAAILGVGLRSVTDYEKGKEPKRPVMLSWALAAGVPLEWLEHGTDPVNGPDGGHTLDNHSSCCNRQKAVVVPIRRIPSPEQRHQRTA